MHVVFDLDGVLLDSAADLDWLDRALDDTLAAYDLEPTQENRDRLYPANLREFERAADAFDVPVEELWRVRNEAYTREKLAAIESGEIGPFPDIHVLEAIADRYPVSIISNSPQPVVDAFLDRVGLEEHVEEAIGRGSGLDAIERLKPDPYFFTVLDNRVEAGSYVYVGDYPSDAEFASQTGMAYIHVDRTGESSGDVDLDLAATTSLLEVYERIEELAE